MAQELFTKLVYIQRYKKPALVCRVEIDAMHVCKKIMFDWEINKRKPSL